MPNDLDPRVSVLSMLPCSLAAANVSKLPLTATARFISFTCRSLAPQILHVGSTIRLAVLTNDVDRCNGALRIETRRGFAAHASGGTAYAATPTTREVSPCGGPVATGRRRLIQNFGVVPDFNHLFNLRRLPFFGDV